MALQDTTQSKPFMIQVIGLESQAECDEILAKALETFTAKDIEVETRTEYVPAVVGALEGFVAFIQAAAPVVGPSIASGVAGAAVKELIVWLKERGKSPRVDGDTAEAIVKSDLELKVGVKHYQRTKRKVLPGCEQALTSPKNCFIFIFEDQITHERHTYVVSNEGEITSYERS